MLFIQLTNMSHEDNKTLFADLLKVSKRIP